MSFSSKLSLFGYTFKSNFDSLHMNNMYLDDDLRRSPFGCIAYKKTGFLWNIQYFVHLSAKNILRKISLYHIWATLFCAIAFKQFRYFAMAILLMIHFLGNERHGQPDYISMDSQIISPWTARLYLHGQPDYISMFLGLTWSTPFHF